tara:strand:- start:839 stop:988 length:150 start_codon:yes stop_codon:yes gene_type:complete
MLYILLTTVIIAYLIAGYQKNRGLNFWPSFFMSFIAVLGVLGVIWKILN